jgi:isopenicillin N synthase-like dioxygenase
MSTAPPTVVPIVNMAPFLSGSPDEKQRVARAFADACEQIGFLTVVGHGVPPREIEQPVAAARAFFDLPAEEKARLTLTGAGAGYSPLQGESLAATLGQAAPADRKESLNVGSDFTATPWPARPASLRPALTAHYRRRIYRQEEPQSIWR